MTGGSAHPPGAIQAGLPSLRVRATLERAAELRASGQLTAAGAALRAALEAEQVAPHGGDLMGRVQLALQLADTCLETGEAEWGQALLEAEAAAVEGASRGAAVEPLERRRLLVRGARVLRDRAIQIGLVGRPAPPFEALTWALGRAWPFGELRGRVVLLEFWATWCRPCLGMFPKLQELHERYAERGLVVLALTRLYGPAPRSPEAEAQELELIRRVVEDRGLEYSVGVLPDERLARAYGASGFPTIGLIDRAGIVRHARFGGVDERLVELIERCLKA